MKENNSEKEVVETKSTSNSQVSKQELNYSPLASFDK